MDEAQTLDHDLPPVAIRILLHARTVAGFPARVAEVERLAASTGSNGEKGGVAPIGLSDYVVYGMPWRALSWIDMTGIEHPDSHALQ
jgi:hypothetical protein